MMKIPLGKGKNLPGCAIGKLYAIIDCSNQFSSIPRIQDIRVGQGNNCGNISRKLDFVGRNAYLMKLL